MLRVLLLPPFIDGVHEALKVNDKPTIQTEAISFRSKV